MLSGRLGRLVLVLMLSAVLLVGLAPAGQAEAVSPSARLPIGPLPIDHYSLFLNGQFAEVLQGVSGGAITADVVDVSEGSDSCMSIKRIGRVSYEDFSVLTRIPPSEAVFDWVSSAFTCDPTRVDGVVAANQFNGTALWAKQFSRALISQVTIPACDAASRQPGYLGIAFSPEVIERVDLATPTRPVFGRGQWISSNFRLEISGLDTSHVRRIEPFSLDRQIVEVREGTSDIVRKLPGKLEVPNLVITLPLAWAASWIQWHQDFVVSGKNTAAEEKEGVLTLLAADRQHELVRILLHHLGIIQAEPVVSPSGGGGLPLMTAVLYCGGMEFLPAVQ